MTKLAIPRRVAATLAIVSLIAVPAAPAVAATIIEVNEETNQAYADCTAAWNRLKREYRQEAKGECKDAGGIQSVAEPTVDQKPVGGKFICTLKGRITCNK